MPDIQIAGVHCEVTDRIKAYVQDKIGALSRYCQDLTQIHVTLHQGAKFGFRVDVEMHVGKGKDVIAHDSEDTLFSAIDIFADNCAQQLRRRHDRVVKKRVRSDRLALSA
jgi:ribosomal subunit interface protein